MEINGERTRHSSVYLLLTGGIIREANRHSSTRAWGRGRVRQRRISEGRGVKWGYVYTTMNTYPISDSSLYTPSQKSRLINLLTSEQESYPLWFSRPRNSYPEQYEHLSDMWLSTLDFVREIAPDYWTVLTECENRIPIRYGFRPGAIAIRNSMNNSIRYVTLHFRLRHRNRARLLNSSYVRTEFLSAIVFVPAQKIAIRNRMNTYPIDDSPL